MWTCDFDHNVLPELKIRTEDVERLNKDYIRLEKVNLAKKYFEDNKLLPPIYPENSTYIKNRLGTFTRVLSERIVTQEDYKKKVFICVTH